jgi:hypothetical protein
MKMTGTATECEHGEPKGPEWCAFCRRGIVGTNSAPTQETLETVILPYAGTSGWSGSETSKQRALDNDSQGITARRQKFVYDLVLKCEFLGITWREICILTGYDKSAGIAGTLSNLHKAGKIARLKQSRGRCAIYVGLPFVADRPTARHGGKLKTHTCTNCGNVDVI